MNTLVPLVILLYGLDQLTKFLVIRLLPLQHSIEIIPSFFSLVHFTNTGAAFGMFKGNNIFFVVLSVAVLIALAVMHARGSFPDTWTRVATALLSAGILGNLTDRLTHGHVVDFLSFDLHIPGANPWPAFNVADSCICVAAGLFIVRSLRPVRREGT